MTTAVLARAVSSPISFWRALAAQGGVLLVYRAKLQLREPPAKAGLEFRKLSDADLESLPEPRRSEELQRLRANGCNAAYAVFSGGALAHISWLITAAEEARRPPRLLRLRSREVEITSCYTTPEFRGRGLYPFAIRHLCQVAARQGFARVFMKTRRDNRGSQIGIEKAGLRPAGHILYFRQFAWRFFRIGL